MGRITITLDLNLFERDADGAQVIRRELHVRGAEVLLQPLQLRGPRELVRL
jgi:hypothetical protein